ncbi:uncharacterized protein [Miscanthus floridulus]|uniref:uncharacterized protein n=1 Tax=Miscanthus floridulus TaxID=154761 RepID=UPI003458602D
MQIRHPIAANLPDNLRYPECSRFDALVISASNGPDSINAPSHTSLAIKYLIVPSSPHSTYQTQPDRAADKCPKQPTERSAQLAGEIDRSMDLLEHPLEAVAFRLYSLPIPEAASAVTGAAAWTCLAAVLAAAAAGLWRLRSSTAAAVAVSTTTKPLELDPSSRAAEVSPSRPSSQRSPPVPAAASTTPTAPSRKEMYTAYFRDAGCVGCCYEDGNNEEDDDADEEHEDGDRDVFVSDGADPFGWEVVRSLPPPLSPTAALGGGSVVQLWDQGVGGGLTPTASPRWRGRVVVVGAVSAF